MPAVRLSGRSHNPADRIVPRFGVEIPIGGHVDADLLAEQIEWLESDPFVVVELIAPEVTESVSGNAGRPADAGEPARPSIRSKRR